MPCHAADDAIRNKVGPGGLLARPLKLPSSDEILASARLDLVLILRCSKATTLYSNIKCELTDLEMEEEDKNGLVFETRDYYEWRKELTGQIWKRC